MSMEYIRGFYKVPAKRGARVKYMGRADHHREGTIVGSRGSHLRIRLDGDTRIQDFHPTWELEYLEEGA